MADPVRTVLFRMSWLQRPLTWLKRPWATGVQFRLYFCLPPLTRIVKPLARLFSMTTQIITQDDRARIRLVADSLRRKAPEPETITALVSNGVPQHAASELYRMVVHGLKAGVAAGVTDGLSAGPHQRGESPIWDAAFDEGRRQFGGTVRAVWLRRLAWLLVPIVAFVIWLLLR